MKRLVAMALISLSVATPADPGFYPVTSPGLPAAITTAAKKVVHVYFFSDRAKFEVRPESLALLASELKRDPVALMESLGLVPDGMIAAVYLNDLAKLKAGESFSFYQTGVGSAFFLESGELITARHVPGKANFPAAFFDAKTPREARDALAKWGVRMVLVAHDGRILFDTRNPDQKIGKIAFSGHVTEVNGLPEEYRKIEKTSLGQMMDVVALRLKGFDARHYLLPVAKEAPKKGDRMYAIGYPLRTTGREMHHRVPDADGLSVRISIGTVLEGPPADYTKFLKTLMGDDETRGRYESALVYSDADFVPGLSGGAYLNEAGEVISVASTVRHDFEVSVMTRYTVTASSGPRLSLLIPSWDKAEP